MQCGDPKEKALQWNIFLLFSSSAKQTKPDSMHEYSEKVTLKSMGCILTMLLGYWQYFLSTHRAYKLINVVTAV